jgi:hypothetical protein
VRSHAKAPPRGSVRIAATAAILAIALLAMTASSAFAALGHPVVRTFSTGPNTGPTSVAVDGDGNVYVLDTNAQRIDKFDLSGNRTPFSASFGYVGGAALTGTGEGPFQIISTEYGPGSSIAVDSSPGPTRGYIYAGLDNADFSHSEVSVFAPDGTYRGRLGERATNLSDSGVAVNPSNGTIYRNVNGSVLRFPAATVNIRASQPNGRLGVGASGLAADSSGAVYLGGEPATKYDASQFGSPSPVPSVTYPAYGRTIAVDPSNGDIYANKGDRILRFNAAGSQQGVPFGSLVDSHGVSVDGSGDIFATDSNGGVFVYAPNQAELPTATTGASSNVTTTSADVEGTVDPDGAGNITACEVRYGEDSGYSTGSTPCSPGSPISGPTGITAHLSGLVSGTTYRYRVFVTNAAGTQMASSDQSFTTPSAIESVGTDGAGEVQKDSAVLNGHYVGDGSAVHYFFEWGPTTAYGHTTPVPPGASSGSGSGYQEVAPIQISGLQGGTTYHYRLVVSTAGGTTRGQDQAFATLEAVTSLTTEAPAAATDTTADLGGSFEGDGTHETHYYFEWGTTTGYGNFAPAPPGNSLPPSTGRVQVPPVQISGLKSGLVYHFRLIASNAVGTSVGADVAFKPAEAPGVGNLNSRDVLSSAAELTGEVNPHLAQTTYKFEWGPTTAYGNVSPVPEGDAGAGSTAVPVAAKLTGLSPDTTYHFRLIATNKYGSTSTVDQTFNFRPPNCPNSQLRQETRSNSLPDCRAFELVSPSFAQGTRIRPNLGPWAPFATSPARLAYVGNFGTFPEETGDPSNVVRDLYVSTRTDDGWYQKFIGRPATETFMMGGPPTNHVENFFTGFFERFDFVGAQTTPDLSRLISYDLGWPSDHYGQVAKNQVSNAPYVWDTGTGKLLERWPSNLSSVPNGERFVGYPQASPDFSHFVFQSNIPFAPGGTEEALEVTCCGPKWKAMPPVSIYDNDLETGAVRLASIKGDDHTTFKGFVFNISNDGSHILMAEEGAFIERAWEDGSHTPVSYDPTQYVDVDGPLYLRADAEHTYEIAPGHRITYLGSTADGRTVYLRSAEQLTPDDQDNSTDLYVWHQGDQQLTLVSVGDAGGNTDSCGITWNGGGCNIEVIDRRGKGNGETDSPIAANGDIYFVSPEQLLEGKGQEGQANLYLYRGGALQFVATLNAEADAVERIQVTPGGNHMAFVTTANVTGYDSGGHAEMYTYAPDTGRISCASCRQDGQPDVSDVKASLNGLFQTYDGRVFFSTNDSLTPQDSNGVMDVYEFTEGRAQLITTGTGSTDSSPLTEFNLVFYGLIGVSANGTDVYFSTTDTLVTQDHNGADLKIYDARTGGGFPAERAVEKCTAADECHGAGVNPPPLPPDRTSASLGQQPQKKKAHKAKKHKKKAHKKKHPKAHKNARAAKGKGKQGGTDRG